MILRLGFFLLFMHQLFVSDVFASAKVKARCYSTEVTTKNCRITYPPYTLQLSEKKITVHDGVWRSIFDFPLINENSQWHKVEFQKKKDLYFLNIYAWDPPKKESEIQSLKWYLFQVKSKKSHLITEQTVWKRYLKEEALGKVLPNKNKKVKKRFGYEPKVKHSFSVNKNNIHWQSGFNKGDVHGL
ncbi:MAG: hypothetical protein HOO06_12645 [Bdellovibrionaceae bacterium]|jgi:hypothetical protein|nr:hypothetical protein [Pseudobdellovibrionaceae bacterium]